MMEKSQNLIASGKERAKICKACGKEGAGIAIRDHIEANHLEGVSLPCNVCEKTFRSRQRLRLHKCTNWISCWSKIKLVKRINHFRTRHALRDHNAKMHRTLWFKACGFLKMYFWKRLHMTFLFPYSLASYLLYLLRNAHFYHRVKIGKCSVLKKVVSLNNCRHLTSVFSLQLTQVLN